MSGNQQAYKPIENWHDRVQYLEDSYPIEESLKDTRSSPICDPTAGSSPICDHTAGSFPICDPVNGRKLVSKSEAVTDGKERNKEVEELPQKVNKWAHHEVNYDALYEDQDNFEEDLEEVEAGSSSHHSSNLCISVLR